MNIKEIDLLKKAVVKEFGGKITYPKDCDSLSAEISSKCNRQISSSTLKRVWGFIKTNSLPSKYTLDTLIDFVGKEKWNSIINLQHDEIKLSNLWSDIQIRTLNQTKIQFGISANNTGIPFYYSVERKFAIDEFETFRKSKKLVHGFIAPNGYGKSVITLSLLDHFYLQEDTKNKDDIVIFIDCGKITAGPYNILSLISRQIQDICSIEQLLSDIKHKIVKTEGQLVIILDAVNEISFNPTEIQQFFESIIQLFRIAEDLDFVKILLTGVPESLKVIHNKQKIFYPGSDNIWFDPELYLKENGNVPLLTDKELEQFFKSLHADWDYKNFKSFSEIIKLPFFLQLYVQSNIVGSEVQSEIDLLYNYIQNNVLYGTHDHKKQEIIFELLAYSHYGIEKIFIDKNYILNKPCYETKAYAELLASGLIYEFKEPKKFLGYNTHIRFTHDILFEFLVINYWLSSYDLTEETFDHLIKHYENSDLLYPLIEWLIKYCVAENSSEVLQLICSYITDHYKWNDSNYKRREKLGNIIAQLGKIILNNEELKKDLMPYYMKLNFMNKAT